MSNKMSDAEYNYITQIVRLKDRNSSSCSTCMLTNYVEFVESMKIYPSRGDIQGALRYSLFALAEEVGELQGKFAKAYRDDNEGTILGNFPSEQDVTLELGDIFFQLIAVITDLGLKVEDVLQTNKDKLINRALRGKIKGSGDNR